MKLSGAPPVYRPKSARATQPKLASPRPAPPPVYRPSAPVIVQAKPAQQPALRPTAPPVYRPVNPAPQRPAALQPKPSPARPAPPVYRPAPPPAVRQLSPAPQTRTVQRVKKVTGAGDSYHTKYGDFWMSEAPVATGKNGSLVVEILERDVSGATTKIQQVAQNTARNNFPVAFVVGLNKKVDPQALGPITSYSKAATQVAGMDSDAKAIAQSLESNGLQGGAYPFVWSATNDAEKGYVFPFWEARSRLTLHAGAQSVHSQLRDATGAEPLVRSMDADVSDDPLFSNLSPSKLYSAVQNNGYVIVTGGYNWSAADVPRALQLTSLSSSVKSNQHLIARLQTVVNLLNQSEHCVRRELSKISAQAVYWPEPNSYMPLSLRQKGAEVLDELAKQKGAGMAQQGENTHFAKQQSVKSTTTSYTSAITTTKPLKDYFTEFLEWFATALVKNTKPTAQEVEAPLLAVRQTHLRLENVLNNIKWQGPALSGSELDYIQNQAKVIVDKALLDCSTKISQELIAPLPA